MFKTCRPVSSPLVAMLARRAGRAAFGFAMLIGAAVLVRAAAADRVFGGAAILATTWAVAIAAGLVAWLIARLVAHRWQPDALDHAGLVVPAVGLALIAPLTVHLAVMELLGASGFDEWVRLSLVITGATHVVFAISSGYRAVSLIAGTRELTVKWVYLIVLFASCVPFIFFLLPPVLVALTGIPLLPILVAPARIVARERATVVATPAVAYACRAR